MSHINWAGTRSYLDKLSMMKRATAVKFMHRWLPTQHFLHKQGRVQSPLCPLCAAQSETHGHLLCCPDVEAVKIRLGRLTECMSTLRKVMAPCPLIVECWEDHLREQLGLSQVHRPRGVPIQVGLDGLLGEACRHQAL